MKIHVIDNKGQILQQFLQAEDDVSFYSDEIQALNAVEASLPDLIFLGYLLRGKDTADYVDLLLSKSAASSIILIGDDVPEDQILACLLNGAKGYQNSRELAVYISKIIKVVSVGEAWITRRMTGKLLDAIRLRVISVANNLGIFGEYIQFSVH